MIELLISLLFNIMSSSLLISEPKEVIIYDKYDINEDGSVNILDYYYFINEFEKAGILVTDSNEEQEIEMSEF